MNLLLVAAGGALGAALRYLAGVGIGRLVGHGFPYATMGVNIFGSLLMGLFIGYMAKSSVAAGPYHLFVAIGLLGGFTTFSSFSLDAITLLQRGETLLAAVYIAGSAGLSIVALLAGLLLMRTV